MEEALLAYLKADSGLSSLVSGRIYWVLAPQGAAKPYIRLLGVGRGIDRAHGGASGLGRRRIQVDIYGTTYLEALTIERAVVALLNNNRFVQSSVRMEAFLDSARDLTEDDAAKTPIIFRQSLDFMVTYATV